VGFLGIDLGKSNERGEIVFREISSPDEVGAEPVGLSDETKTYLSDTIVAVAGGSTVDLSAGNVTISDPSSRMRLTGATASRTVTLPATVLDLFIENATDYDHFITRTGGGSLPIPAGSTVEFVSA
jgi:hypothetical protein